MIFPDGINVYGDKSYRDKKCPLEDADLVTFFNQLRKLHPDFFRVALHIKNEGKRSNQQVTKDRAKGALNSGASDIVIVGNPTFICELKRQDHTLSTIQKDQVDFLVASRNKGSFVCIALGWQAAIESFEKYLELHYS